MSFTTITDTLTNADGSGFTGTLAIYPLGSNVPIDKVPVAAGALVVKLQPGYYVAVGEMAGQTSGVFEHWIVTSTSTTLASVRGILRYAQLEGIKLITAVVAPADASLAANQAVLWFDPTDAAGKLMIKAKTADGTVVGAEVDLS